MSNELLIDMAQSIINGDRNAAAELAQQALVQGMNPLEAINSGFVVGVNQVGEQYSQGAAFVPDLVLAGAAMESAMKVLEPELAKGDIQRDTLGTVVLATVAGDIHDIGKNIVRTMLTSSGFTVYDLGADVPIQAIVEKVKEVKADLVAVSALLTTTMSRQEDVVKAIEEAGLRDSVKVIVGGAPVTQEWVDEIGADGFGEDAVGAVRIAKAVLGKD
jgi:corrinoid protein of di/trimethylamine methyltransferase